MKTAIINHQQGSEAWHQHRTRSLNASELASVMGLSTYTSRSELIKQKATGITPEIDAQTQRRFDAGHEFEAIARPWAEEIIGGDLYPVVLAGEVDGLNLSASLDGLDMASEISWEHKTGRADLLASLEQGVIPDEYHPQMEMGLMLSGAEKCLFMASSGDKEAMRWAWYLPNFELRAKIIPAWTQFSIDLAAYVPPEVIVPAVAAPQMGLPAVSITVIGSIALVDNLDKFGAALTAYIERINKKPETDQDFADLESTVKTLKTAEDALDAAEANALAQTDSIDAMRRTVALYRDTARTNRLLIEKLVKAEKENRRAAILRESQDAFAAHIDALNARLGKPYMPMVPTDFAGAIKGLKSIDSMRDKVDTELARAKIEANAVADRISINLMTIGAHAGMEFLFADRAALVLKAPDDLAAVVQNRIAAHQAKEAERIEAQRQRIAAEEQAKAQAAERARADAEIAAATAKARAEAHAQAQADAAAKRASDDAIAKAAAPAMATQADPVPYLAAEVVIDQPNTGHTIRLGQICERLDFVLTADFLGRIGFHPASTEKNAKLYREADFPRICAALVRHIENVAQGVAA